jgi:hypothetical protein
MEIDTVDAKKLAAIKAMLEDHTPGDDSDLDSDVLAMILVIAKQKGKSDE